MTRNLIQYSLTAQLLLLCLSSCMKDRDYVEQPVSRIYRLDGIALVEGPHEGWGPNEIGIQPLYSYDEDFDHESRLFYANLDTTLVFKGNLKITGKNLYMQTWQVLDLRISSINITTLVDYDETHPTGSSLTDIFDISYWYKRTWIKKPVSDITYGGLMLGDLIPVDSNYYAEYPGLKFTVRGADFQLVPPIEVCIKDAFGNEFLARTETQ